MISPWRRHGIALALASLAIVLLLRADVIAADLVAAIGRKRRAMGEEQQVHHPRPRAIQGPIALATGSGSRCQLRTISAYLGLSGLTSRAAPSPV